MDEDIQTSDEQASELRIFPNPVFIGWLQPLLAGADCRILRKFRNFRLSIDSKTRQITSLWPSAQKKTGCCYSDCDRRIIQARSPRNPLHPTLLKLGGLGHQRFGRTYGA